MKRAVVFAPIWGLGCIFLVLSSSCRHSDLSGDGLSDAVNLSAEVVRGASKGSPATADNLTQWAVFGYRQGEKLWSDELQASILPSLFYDVPVDKQSDGSWSYGQPVKWGGLPYDRYAFFGYAPKAAGRYEDPINPLGNNLEVVGTSSTAGVAQLQYETLVDVTNQIDLLAGMRTNVPASDKVTMQLGHMLSQIRFVAWSVQVGVTPVSIAINGIQYKGILSSKDGKAAWLSTDPAVRGFDLRGNFPALSIKEDQKTDLSANGRSFMLLPQDLSANATATMDIVALVGGVEVASAPYVINENWEAGKSYTYVLKLGGNPAEELIVTDVLVTDWVVDSEEDLSTTPVGYEVNPPTASDYVEIDGLKWTTGNLVAKNKYQCVVGAPTDGGLYFQFGSLIGYKGGDLANGGKGVGSNPNTGSNMQWWGGATSWSWSNEAMVWPAAMTSTPTAWSPNAAQATEADAFNKWYFDFSGTSGGVNYSAKESDIRSYTHPTLGALKEGKMASLGIGDPCTYYLGDPWRLPTAAEYKAVFDNVGDNTAWSSVANWSWVTSPYNGAQRTGNTLYVPASGYRYSLDGSFYNVTGLGYGWSSSVDNAASGFYLSFNGSVVTPQNYYHRSNGFPVRCVSGTYVKPSNPVNPPTASDYVEIDGLKWTKGNLVASSSTAGKTNGCKVGAPTDGGLYFQFGSLIGYKGGATEHGGTGVGSNPDTESKWWGGAGSWRWTNDAMVWPAIMSGTPSSWPQSTSGTAHQWYFSGDGVTSGEINVNDPTKGVGDPCTFYLGDPWRLPTTAEYKAVFDDVEDGTAWSKVANWSWVTSPYPGAQRTGNTLYVPFSGSRYDSDGSFYYVTGVGYGWSSSVYSAANGHTLSVYGAAAYPQRNSYRSDGFPVRCVSGQYTPSNPVNPPTASDYVEIDGLKWTKGNLVASSSTVGKTNGCKVGAPTDGGLYFQFGSLIGYKGGATANGGTGVGSNPNTGSGTQWWGGAGSWSWTNDAMVWPTIMAGTPSSWPQSTSGTAHQWYFSGNGVTSGEINVNDPTKGVGDPCTYYLGDPWRTPTGAEYAVLCNKKGGIGTQYSWSDVGGSWVGSGVTGGNFSGTQLFFPASGYRHDLTGSFYGVARSGTGWSSSVYAAVYGLYLTFSGSVVSPQGNGYRSYGFPVRCVSSAP